MLIKRYNIDDFWMKVAILDDQLSIADLKRVALDDFPTLRESHITEVGIGITFGLLVRGTKIPRDYVQTKGESFALPSASLLEYWKAKVQRKVAWWWRPKNRAERIRAMLAGLTMLGCFAVWVIEFLVMLFFFAIDLEPTRLAIAALIGLNSVVALVMAVAWPVYVYTDRELTYVHHDFLDKDPLEPVWTWKS